MTKTGLGQCNIMHHRVVAGILSAEPCPRPNAIPQARLRGTKRLGMKYEKDFANALALRFPRATIAAQWFRFVDANGSGYCQPDVILQLPGQCIIFECKLTDTEKGRSQLGRLYIPVVERCYRLPARGIVVTRHLSKETEVALVTDELPMAMGSPKEVIPTLHWRERNPL